MTEAENGNAIGHYSATFNGGVSRLGDIHATGENITGSLHLFKKEDKKMQKTETIADLASAMVKAQGGFKAAVKDSDNPYFKSKYADLHSVMEVIKEPFSKNGLCLLQPVSAEGAKVTITTIILHSTGQFISSELSLMAKDSSPQAIASATTYARRNAVCSMLGISAKDEDDDGNAAQPRPASKPFYDNSDIAMVKTLFGILNKKAIPEHLHEKIGSMLHGKSSSELEHILKELQ